MQGLDIWRHQYITFERVGYMTSSIHKICKGWIMIYDVINTQHLQRLDIWHHQYSVPKSQKHVIVYIKKIGGNLKSITVICINGVEWRCGGVVVQFERCGGLVVSVHSVHCATTVDPPSHRHPIYISMPPHAERSEGSQIALWILYKKLKKVCKKY